MFFGVYVLFLLVPRLYPNSAAKGAWDHLADGRSNQVRQHGSGMIRLQ